MIDFRQQLLPPQSPKPNAQGHFDLDTSDTALASTIRASMVEQGMRVSLTDDEVFAAAQRRFEQRA